MWSSGGGGLSHCGDQTVLNCTFKVSNGFAKGERRQRGTTSHRHLVCSLPLTNSSFVWWRIVLSHFTRMKVLLISFLWVQLSTPTQHNSYMPSGNIFSVFVTLYQQTGGKPKCTIFTCQGWVYVVFNLELKYTQLCVIPSRRKLYSWQAVCSQDPIYQKTFFLPMHSPDKGHRGPALGWRRPLTWGVLGFKSHRTQYSTQEI